MACPTCGQPVQRPGAPCPRCGAAPGQVAATPRISRRVVAPVLASLVVITFGVLVMASYASGASTGGKARAQWTPTPTTPEGITRDALRSFAKASFGSPGSKGGVAPWWDSVIALDVKDGYAIADTSLEDTARDIRHATDVCVALVYFANDKGREGMRLTRVRVTGKGGLVLFDTTSDAIETDPCQTIRARPTRARD